MAEVDDVIRAAVAAGELIIRAAEETARLLHGAGTLAVSLAGRLASARGGGTEQVPLADLAGGRALSAFEVSPSAVEEVRQIARREGVPFALAHGPDTNTRILVCLTEHAHLFSNLRHLGHTMHAAQVPDIDTPDADFFTPTPGTSYDAWEFAPGDAAWFCTRAAQQGVPFAASDPRTTPGGCQKDAEILREEAEDLFRDDPAWQTVRKARPQTVIFPAAAPAELSSKIPPDIPFAAAQRAPQAVLAAFRASDRRRIIELFPVGQPVSLVDAAALTKRFETAHSAPLHVAAAAMDRERIQDMLQRAGRTPAVGPRQAAVVVKCCDSLETRVARALRQMSLCAAGGRNAVLSCTLYEDQAQAFRTAARQAGLAVAAKETGGGFVRFDVPQSHVSQANALLKACGITVTFAPRARTSADRGR